MEVLDIDLNRKSICTPIIVMMMIFIITKVLDCRRVMEDVAICLLIPATLPLIIMQFIILAIELVTIVEVNICLKRPNTLPLVILEQELMLTVELDIGLITATLPNISHVAVADFWVYFFILFCS